MNEPAASSQSHRSELPGSELSRVDCRLDRLRILVAEDGEIKQEVIGGILEMQGCEVVLANDGAEAARMASTRSFDLCLMDVDMPVMDGIEATRAIRKSMDGQLRFPIVAMTAHSGDQIWKECESAGKDAYLSKPIEPASLFSTIERQAASTTACE